MIITYVCMLILVCSLGFSCLYKATLVDRNNDFFGITSTSALRGFWCIIIVLVHVPQNYGNRIQDLIGSFAYIGVTFFFMTSGYGLRLGVRKEKSINNFWRKRLPKILVPMIFVNIVDFIVVGFISGSYELSRLVRFDRWVQWLLVCYIVVWLFYRFNIMKEYKDGGIIAVLVLFSLCIFFLGDKIQVTTWTTEIYGFIWGIVLATKKCEIENKLYQNWKIKATILFIVSLMLGLLYIKYKHVFFFGGYLLKIILGLVMLTFILQLTTRVQIGNPIILFLGKISYEIYLIHGIAFYIIEKKFPEMCSGMFILTSIILTIGISVIVYWLSDNSNRCYLVYKGEKKWQRKN